MRRHSLLIPVLALGVLASNSARAEAPGAPPPEPPPYSPRALAPAEPRGWDPALGPPPGWRYEPTIEDVPVRWYGWQTLIGVVAGDALVLLGSTMGARDGAAVMYVGLAAHALTGPIVHWGHGHVGRGFASLGLSAGLPIAGALIGVALADSTQDFSTGFAVAMLFGGLGYFGGPALDMALLSTEPVEEPGKAKGFRALLPSSVAVVPMVHQDRLGLSLMGQL